MASSLPKGTLGCDYSYARPGGAALAGAGYKFAFRYLSYEPQKNINAAELADLHNHGLYVGFVWETNGVSILGGAPTGAVEGTAAKAELDAMGVPATVPIFVALDEDDRAVNGWPNTIQQYLNAFAKASGHYALPYGSNRVIDFFRSGWQTEAWSGGAMSPFAAIYQRASGQTAAFWKFPPNTLDEDVLLADQAVFYGPPNAPVAPTPTPTPPGEIVQYPGNVNSHGPLDFASHGVLTLQALLYANGLLIAPRNVNHAVLTAAINRVQEINRWPMTGVADERVWAWLLRKA